MVRFRASLSQMTSAVYSDRQRAFRAALTRQGKGLRTWNDIIIVWSCFR